MKSGSKTAIEPAQKDSEKKNIVFLLVERQVIAGLSYINPMAKKRQQRYND